MGSGEEEYWHCLRQFTTARIGTGRHGTGLTTNALLDFQLAFARARDAVRGKIDAKVLARSIAPVKTIDVQSQAPDRSSYLLRPDLGRRLSEQSASRLAECRANDSFDLVFVIGDGLSAGAAERYAPTVIEHCRAGLADFSIAPVVIASQARVALADQIAELLNARMAMILIGERPGLTTPRSLGLYLTWQPRVGLQDSARNCISNVHDSGLSCRAAAAMAVWLIREANRLKLSGVGLKENAGYTVLADDTTAASLTWSRDTT